MNSGTRTALAATYFVLPSLNLSSLSQSVSEVHQVKQIRWYFTSLTNQLISRAVKMLTTSFFSQFLNAEVSGIAMLACCSLPCSTWFFQLSWKRFHDDIFPSGDLKVSMHWFYSCTFLKYSFRATTPAICRKALPGSYFPVSPPSSCFPVPPSDLLAQPLPSSATEQLLEAVTGGVSARSWCFLERGKGREQHNTQ